MPPRTGLSASSPDRLLSACTRAASLLALPAALLAVCAPPVFAQTMAVGDRYSGEVYAPPAYRQAGGGGGPTLSWPGKTAASAPPPAAPSPGFDGQMRAPAYAYAPQAYRADAPTASQPPMAQQAAQSPAYQAPAYQTPAYQTPSYQAPPIRPPAYPAQVARAQAQPTGGYGPPPVAPWYQRYGAAEASPAPSTVAAPAPPPIPQSIYDPPAGQGAATTGAPTAALSAASSAAAMAPTATASNSSETARFYSLHRQYGLTPDPDPIPPQFFTQTADLSDPPGPSPVYKTATSSGGSTTAVHPVQSDDPTSTLAQP